MAIRFVTVDDLSAVVSSIAFSSGGQELFSVFPYLFFALRVYICGYICIRLFTLSVYLFYLCVFVWFFV